MVSDYQNKMFQQLEEVMLKCDSLALKLNNIEKEHKQEIKRLKKDITNKVTIELNARC